LASDGTYSDKVYVSWNASSGATSYNVYRATSTSGLKPIIATVTSRSYNDTPPACGTPYYYWVSATNSAGTSGLSSSNSGYCDSGSVDPPIDPPVGGVAALTATQAKAEIDESLGLIIVDARESNYYSTGHLLCAENCAWNTAFEFMNYNVIANYKDIDILLYDQDGSVALSAANYLASEGFSTVYYISGGLNAWEAKDYETVTTAGPCSIPPMADAGEDQTAVESASVTLDGSGSAAASGTLTYIWTQSSGTNVVLLNPKTAKPTFTAPAVQEGGQELIFHLKVVNEQQVADTDSVSVFVTWSPINSPPVANAGLDRSKNEGDTVTLNANGSTDPDGLSDIVSYSWKQTNGTPTVMLSNPGSAVATFTAPDVFAQTTLTFRVTVTDSEDNSDTDDVQITIINPAAANTPDADAGNDAIVDESTAVTLDGSGSTTPSGTITGYQWTQTSGTNVTIKNSTSAQASFTAPAIDSDSETLTFSLTVTNSANLSSLPDTVTILVKNVLVTGKPPVSYAGSPQTVYGGETVTLNGAASFDTDGTIAAYQWLQIFGPDVTLSDASSSTPAFIAPIPTDSSIILEFELTVTDNDNNQDTDDVTIVVDTTQPPVADAGPDQTVKENKTVTLDGSGSTDGNWGDDGIKSYLWEQISGTPVALSADDTVQVEFEAPKVGSLITLIFELTVENYSGQQSSDIVAITVKNNSSDDSTCFISAIQ
jgi:rhodanese-related sulfurtransferase